MNEVGKVIFFFPWKKLKVLRDHIAITYYLLPIQTMCNNNDIHWQREKKSEKGASKNMENDIQVFRETRVHIACLLTDCIFITSMTSL